jgi:hypothetical protein
VEDGEVVSEMESIDLSMPLFIETRMSSVHTPFCTLGSTSGCSAGKGAGLTLSSVSQKNSPAHPLLAQVEQN